MKPKDQAPTPAEPSAPAATPAETPAPATHAGNDPARNAEAAALVAEAELLSRPGESPAVQELHRQELTEAQRKHNDAKDCVLMVAKPCFDLATPNWRDSGHLSDKALDTWADGITPALLKYFPDLDEKLPPELVALLVTAMTFGPLIKNKVPAFVPEKVHEGTPS